MYVCVYVVQEEMIFQIPWKHAAKHGWDINKDACLFRSWAIHTGVTLGLWPWRQGKKQWEALIFMQRFLMFLSSLK